MTTIVETADGGLALSDARITASFLGFSFVLKPTEGPHDDINELIERLLCVVA